MLLGDFPTNDEFDTFLFSFFCSLVFIFIYISICILSYIPITWRYKDNNYLESFSLRLVSSSNTFMTCLEMMISFRNLELTQIYCLANQNFQIWI